MSDKDYFTVRQLLILNGHTVMPHDYTLIAGILGSYLGDHPEQEDMVADAIVRLSTDLENADVVDGCVFWHTAHHASLV